MSMNMNHVSRNLPILDADNFDYWKSRIKPIIRSAGEEIWDSCIVEYTRPMKTVEDKVVKKIPI